MINPFTIRLAVVVLATAALGGCGGQESPSTTETAPTLTDPATTSTPSEPAPEPVGGGRKPPNGGADGSSGPAEGPGGDPRLEALGREAEGTVRAFVAALDAGDGARACALLAPGAIGELELPRSRGSCAASLDASIGFRDPRGLPVWEGAQVSAVKIAELGPQRAKLVVTVVTTFADRDEVSIEDDVVYLERGTQGWLIAKPSSTLYRAVGIADVPPSVLSPPDP